MHQKKKSIRNKTKAKADEDTPEEIAAKRAERAAKKALALAHGKNVDLTSMTKASANALSKALSNIPIDDAPVAAAVAQALLDIANNASIGEDKIPSSASSKLDNATFDLMGGPEYISKHITFEYGAPLSLQMCKRKLDPPSYLWNLNDARKIFRDKNFWPSFMGSRIDFELEEKGALPVFLWPEQMQYTPPAALTASFGKRKRGEPDPDDDLELVGKVIKRRKVGIIRSVINGIKSFFSSTFSFNLRESIKPVTTSSASTPSSSSSTATFVGYVDSTTSSPIHPATKPVMSPQLAYITLSQLIRMSTFNDLMLKGFFIGPGDIYGSDYSIYLGDPSQGHSVATIRLVTPLVIANGVVSKAKVSARDILSYSRVQNHVAKKAVYAFLSDNAEQERRRDGTIDSLQSAVCYISINFLGVSRRV